MFTTIGNWRQDAARSRAWARPTAGASITSSSKVLDLPARTSQPFELALSSYEETDRELLERHGWRVRDALSFSRDLDAYRAYIVGSRGEFTVAKDQERAAAERVVQRAQRACTWPPAVRSSRRTPVSATSCRREKDSFAFSTMEEILDALDRVDRTTHGTRALPRRLLREYFSYDVVLGRMLRELGIALFARAAITNAHRFSGRSGPRSNVQVANDSAGLHRSIRPRRAGSVAAHRRTGRQDADARQHCYRLA